jgi:hypothetical protein
LTLVINGQGPAADRVQAQKKGEVMPTNTVFEFDIKIFHNAFVTGDDQMLRENLKAGMAVLADGGSLAIQRIHQGFTHADKELVKTIRNVPEFMDWVKHLNKVGGFNMSF